MKKNLIRLRALLVVAFLTFVAVMPLLAAERQYEWSNVARIVAVGDVHGDYDKMVICLKANGVIDDDNKWTGGMTHLVQVGDILGKGPDSKKAMDLLIDLQQQAKNAGGVVHALTGNNEAAVLRGDYKNLDRTEIEPYGGMEALKKAMTADGKYGKWIRSQNAVIKINDILFVHGGISPRYAALSLQAINKDVTESLGRNAEDDKEWPLVYSGWAAGDESRVKKLLEPVFKNYGIRHIVKGHNVTNSQVIELKADGALIMIDVGMSKTAVSSSGLGNGPAMSLLIENGKFYAVTPEEKNELPLKRAVNFPSRPVTLICPYAQGLASDKLIRTLAEAASKFLQQPVVVVNKSGAGGTMGASELAKATTSDGYLISQMPSGVFRQPHMKNADFDPVKDFTWIIGVSGFSYGVAVRADAPWKTWSDFIVYAKANPGAVSYASTGVGTPLHLTMEKIAGRDSVRWKHVIYKDGKEAADALIGGKVEAWASSLGWSDLINAGKIRMLVSWGEKRTRQWPNVPTLKDVGYEIVTTSPYGIAGPKSMRPEIVKVLHDAFKKATETPDFQKVLMELDQELWYLDSMSYAKYAAETFEAEREIVRSLSLKP